MVVITRSQQNRLNHLEKQNKMSSVKTFSLPPPPPPSSSYYILILGYFDRGNIGDQAYIQSYLKLFGCNKNNQTKLIFQSIDDFNPNDYIRTSSYLIPSQNFNPNSTINQHVYVSTEINTQCLLPNNDPHKEYDQSSPWSTLHALIVAGGDVVNDYFMTKIQVIIQRCKCPCYLFSAGIPYESGCKYLHMFDHVILRSHADVNLAVSEIGRSNVTYSPDFSWMLSLDNCAQSSLAKTNASMTKQKKKRRMAKTLSSLSNHSNLKPNQNVSSSLFECCKSLYHHHNDDNGSNINQQQQNQQQITDHLSKPCRVLRIGVCLAQPAFYNNPNKDRLCDELIQIFHNIASEMTIKNNDSAISSYDQVEFHLMSFNISQYMSESDHIINQNICNIYETSCYKLDQIKIIPTYIKQQYNHFYSHCEDKNTSDTMKDDDNDNQKQEQQFNHENDYRHRKFGDVHLKGEHDPSAEKMYAYFASRPFDFMIGMRYHSIVFAMMAKIPFLALYVTKKVQSLIDDFKASTFTLDSPNQYQFLPFDGCLLPFDDKYQPTEFPIEQISSQTCNLIRHTCLSQQSSSLPSSSTSSFIFPSFVVPVKQIKEIVFNGIRKNVIVTNQTIQMRRSHTTDFNNMNIREFDHENLDNYVNCVLITKCISLLISYLETKKFTITSSSSLTNANCHVLENTLEQWFADKLSTRELCVFVYYWKLNHGIFEQPTFIHTEEYQYFEKQLIHGIAMIICFAITNQIASPFVWGFETHLTQNIEHPDVKNCIKYIYENSFLKNNGNSENESSDTDIQVSETAQQDHVPLLNWKNMKQLQVVIDINYIEQDNYKDLHRSGWSYAIEGLQHFDTTHLFKPAEIYVDTCLERTFLWGLDTAKAIQLVPYGGKQHSQKWWCGFIHHTFYDRHNPYNCNALLQTPEFIESIQNGSCKALFVLSKTLKKQFEVALKKALLENGNHTIDHIPPVFAIEHPMQFVPDAMRFVPDVMFNLDSDVPNPEPQTLRIIQIGAWMRNPFAIYKLPVYHSLSSYFTLKKTHLCGKQMDSYFRPPNTEVAMISLSSEAISQDQTAYRHHHTTHQTKSHEKHRPTHSRAAPVNTRTSTIIDHTQNKYVDGLMQHVNDLHNSVEVLSFASNAEYDKLLSKSIVFLHLYDAAAVNTVIECIVRNTPLIVNRLPALEEILGKDYPGFYEDTVTLHDAASMAMDWMRLCEIYNHLIAKIDKSKFTIEHFLNTFQDCLSQVMFTTNC